MPPARRFWWALAAGFASEASAVALLAVSAWLIVRASEQPPVLYLSAAVVGVRFFAISRDAAPRRDIGRACIALDLSHEAGALHAALGEAASRGLNLRSLVARPARGRPFHYRFYLELDRPDDATIAALQGAFGARMQLLGSY